MERQDGTSLILGIVLSRSLGGVARNITFHVQRSHLSYLFNSARAVVRESLLRAGKKMRCLP